MSATPAQLQLEQGTYVVRVLPSTPYIFLNWDDGDTNPTKTIVLANNLALVAVIGLLSFDVVGEAGAGGSIDPSGVISIIAGDGYTFKATPSTGYRFNRYLLDGVPVNPSQIVFNADTQSYDFTLLNVQAVHTVRAEFAVNPAPSEEPTRVTPYQWLWEPSTYLIVTSRIITSGGRNFVLVGWEVA